MSIPILPESAPFSVEQRAWLNGFFAGLLGLSDDGSSALATVNGYSSASMNGSPTSHAVEEEAFPWHDPSLTLDERLQLADGKPVERQLMAAMAQLNCGACGYLCQSYGEALACGEEKDTTRCAPGGKDTAKALQRMLREREASQNEASAPIRAIQAPAAKASAATPPPGTHRNHPFTARLIESRRLTHPDSAKDTRHVAINLLNSGITYQPGDSLGVLPENAPELVTGVLSALGLNGDEKIGSADGADRSLSEALTHDYALSRVRPSLVEALAATTANVTHRNELSSLLKNEDGLESLDVLELLDRFPGCTLSPEDLISNLGKLQPRLYSISSSQRACPSEVHLTVGVVRWEARGRWRNGVASHFLGIRCQSEAPVRVFVQPSKFRLPDDPSTPIIMVGPGTGIAPFRAFLQERAATGATGPSWLLFGNQHFDYDFLYREELENFLDGGALTRLDLAFSRDRAQKVYVQHHMLQNAALLWDWLEQGAHFYVCGDGKRMAVDVNSALVQVVETQGGMSLEKANAYVQALAKAKRYHRDVY